MSDNLRRYRAMISHGVRGVFQGLDNRSTTQHRAVAFQASQHEQGFEVSMLLLQQELCIAQQRFQLQGCQKNQWREKGPGYLIIGGDLRHFPVDALRQPSPHDHMDTGLWIASRSSHTLHRVASGWW